MAPGLAAGSAAGCTAMASGASPASSVRSAGRRPPAGPAASGSSMVSPPTAPSSAVGVDCLTRGSTRPQHVPHAAFDDARRERLRDLLHRPPRAYGKPTSVWTLDAGRRGQRRAGADRHAASAPRRSAPPCAGWGSRWRRAKRWITSPDPAYQRKKHARDRLLRLIEAHPDWALGFEDEVWWSRLAQPEPAHLGRAGATAAAGRAGGGQGGPGPQGAGLLRAADPLGRAGPARARNGCGCGSSMAGP